MQRTPADLNARARCARAVQLHAGQAQDVPARQRALGQLAQAREAGRVADKGGGAPGGAVKVVEALAVQERRPRQLRPGREGLAQLRHGRLDGLEAAADQGRPLRLKCLRVEGGLVATVCYDFSLGVLVAFGVVA